MNNTPKSRANRPRSGRSSSLDNDSRPLIGSIPQRKADRRAQDEVNERDARMYEVSSSQCWTIYLILASIYLGLIGIIFFARRPEGFVPALPQMAPNETAPGHFNPFTAKNHLEAITVQPHPFNSRANTEIVKKYILSQFEALQKEAIALGRHNVRYDHGPDDSTLTRIRKSKQQTQMENDGQDEPSEGEALKPQILDVIQGDNLVMWVGGVTESKEGDIPVMIEIDVNQESQSALMISAHYDSVPSSFGETDDGGGVSVALALIRHFIHHPVQHTLIFNINNAEEIGLFGAETFMGARPNSTTEIGTGHPWKKFVKAFINLEGGGSGGPSLLFRATDYDIIRHYAENAPFPHASVFTNDVFKFGLINSDTDYSTYIEHGLPGLDIAFYQRRSMYHTLTDHLPISSLYHMGSNAQATITGLCNSDYLDSLNLQVEDFGEPMPISPRLWFAGKSIFYDLLGKQMVFSDFWTVLFVNALILGLGLPVLALTIASVGKAIKRRQYERIHARQPLIQNAGTLRSVLQSSSSSIGNSEDGYGSISSRPSHVRQHGRQNDADSAPSNLPHKTVIFTFLVALIILSDIGAIVAASKWQSYINPLARFSHPWLILVGLAWSLLVVNTLLVYLITVIEARKGQVPILRGASQWTLAIGVWWWFIAIVIGAGVSGWLGVGALYGTTVLAIFAGIAAVAQLVIDFSSSVEADSSKFGWILVLGLGLLVPGTVILDLEELLVNLTDQSLIGPGNDLFYVLYGIFLIPVLLPTVPVISRGRNFKTALAWELIVLVLVGWGLSQVEPFNSQSPSALYFYQHYNQDFGTSTVDLRTDSPAGYIQRMIQDIPVDSLSQCDPTAIDDGSPYSEICSFVPNRQVFEDKGEEKPIQFNWTKVSQRGSDGWRESHIEILAPESRTCSIYLRRTGPGRDTRLLMKGEDSPHTTDNHRPKTLHYYSRNWNTSWTAIIRVKEQEKDMKEEYRPVPLKITCAYNDWYSNPGYASVFNEMRTQIPDWVRMRMYERDLFEVSVETEA